MNIQFKKGILELCVLFLVAKKDYYGYELVKTISARINISEGAVYPILRRLTEENYFTTYLEPSKDGPARKYYQITLKGKEYQEMLLNEWHLFLRGVNDLLTEGAEKHETK